MKLSLIVAAAGLSLISTAFACDYDKSNDAQAASATKVTSVAPPAKKSTKVACDGGSCAKPDATSTEPKKHTRRPFEIATAN